MSVHSKVLSVCTLYTSYCPYTLKFSVSVHSKVFVSVRVKFFVFVPVFRIRIIWSDPDPDSDLYQEALIWIRVAPKDYSGKKSIFLKFFNFFVTFRPVSEYIINIVYKL